MEESFSRATYQTSGLHDGQRRELERLLLSWKGHSDAMPNMPRALFENLLATLATSQRCSASTFGEAEASLALKKRDGEETRPSASASQTTYACLERRLAYSCKAGALCPPKSAKVARFQRPA